MKKIIALLLGGLLVGCAPLTPPTPHDIIWHGLTEFGFRVVDVTMMEEMNNTNIVTPVRTICLSATDSAAFRAFDNQGKTVVGVACLEQDNTITISLQKTVG